MTTVEELTTQAEAAFKINEYEKAKDLCRQGIKMLERSEDKESVKATIKFLAILSESDRMQGKWFDSIISLERIIVLAEGQKDLNAKADAIIKIGYNFLRSGKWDKASAKFEEAKQIVQKFKNPNLLGLTLGGLGEINFRTGKIADAIADGQKMLEIGESLGDDFLIGKAANLIANGWYHLGKFELALEANSKTIEANRRANSKASLAMVLNNRGEIYKSQGEYEKALECYNEGLGSVGKKAAIHELAYFYPNIAECHARLGQIALAKKAIEKAEKTMKASEDKYAVAYLWMIKGIVEFQDGNRDAALDWLSKAEKRMVSLNVPYDTGIITLEHGLTLINTNIRG
jgi:tetratricopeptide (TPR) repeat protein